MVMKHLRLYTNRSSEPLLCIIQSMKYNPVDLSKIHTYSLHNREHKSIGSCKNLPDRGSSCSDFIDSLPDFLGAQSFKRLVDEIVLAYQTNSPVVAAMGGHVIKVGCGPVIIDLIKRGVIKAIACNGSFAIHDVEIALFGKTSEDVTKAVLDGSFGMVQETFDFFNKAIAHSQLSNGLGHSIGDVLIETDKNCVSVIKTAREYDIPCCIHVALGTDTIHMADLNISQLANASMYDFRLLCDVVSKLGVWLNIGSAVIMPEVFLKAVTVARNLGAELDNLFTANFDMIQHYRPHQNVVTRPVKPGYGVQIIGHHEIMLPLLRQAIIEKISERSSKCTTFDPRLRRAHIGDLLHFEC